jgi:muconate cycloisomerase
MNSIITRIRATQVVVHARKGFVDRPAFGDSLFDKGKKWIIELHTDSGIAGFGETPRRAPLSDIQYAAKHLLGKSLRSLSWAKPVPTDYSSHDALGHENPPVPHRFHEQKPQLPGGAQGVVIAVQDAIGKAIGWRVCDLFGGAHREWVATDWWMGRSDPRHAATQMQEGLKRGYNSIKLKAAAEDDIVGILQAIKQTAGDTTSIVVDPNLRFYRLNEAVAIAKRIEDAGLTNIKFEDPFPFNAEEWRLFREKVSIPLTCHGATQTHVALDEHACDYVNLSYPADEFLAKAAMADQYNVQCWGGSGVELGLFDTYMLHYAAAAKNCVLPGDAMGHDIREDDLIEQTLETRDGHIKLPEAPGLGVTLDYEAMKKYTTDTWESAV